MPETTAQSKGTSHMTEKDAFRMYKFDKNPLVDY